MKIGKIVTAFTALAVVGCMLASLTACSTPRVALTVDGKDYETGEYLAYMADVFQQVYYDGGLYYYGQYGTDVWAQEYTYNEEKLKLAEYIKAVTVDTVIRQKALENKLTEEKVTVSDDIKKGAQSIVDSADESVLLSYGVSKESYQKMCMAYYCNEQALFLARYDEGGSSPVAEADLRKYFDENYLSYKAITVSMVDSEGKEFTADKQKETKDKLQKYLDMYNKNGDFNKVIAQYAYDNDTAEDKKLETLTDEDTRYDIDAGNATDEDFAKALKKVGEGKAEIVTYSANGTTLTAGLVLRLDPEQGADRKDYYKNNRLNLLRAVKYEEFNKEIEDYAKTLKYTVNSSAYRLCDPKEFVPEA